MTTGRVLYEENLQKASYTQLAKKYGLTKGQVAGRIRDYKAGIGVYGGVFKAPEPLPQAVSGAGMGMKLNELKKGDCRFPYGERDYTFCGEPVKPGSPYCGQHHKQCYTGRPALKPTKDYLEGVAI